MKKLIINALVYLALAISCVIGAGRLPSGVWHDALLLIGGVFLGGLAALTVLIMQSNQKHKENEDLAKVPK